MNEYLKQMNLVACLWIACVSVFAEIDQDDQNTMITNRPNVLLILIDDVGIETVSAYGSEIATPNIDRLAEEGVLFTNGHATPVCTPTRTRLLTGTYNFKHYSRFMHLDKSTYTISEHFKSHGYGTLIVGKWQLVGTGNEREAERGKTPGEAGFDESFVWNYEHRSRGSRFWGPTLTHNGQTERFCDSDFGPDLLNSYLTDYIRRKREQPFFIYYPMVLAHDPWVKTPDSMDAETTRERFHGMMKYTDKMIGNVIRVLEEEGLRDDTIIWLIGDNGTHEDVTTRMGDRLVRGGKGLTTDNGTHVPFILSWPQGIHLGQTVDSLVEVLDVFPTLASLLNNHIPPALDGKDLMPVISGDKKEVRDAIFMHYAPRWTGGSFPLMHARFVFNKEYKLYGDGRFFRIASDINEVVPYRYLLDDQSLEQDARDNYRKLESIIKNMNDPPLSPPFRSPKLRRQDLPEPPLCRVKL